MVTQFEPSSIQVMTYNGQKKQFELKTFKLFWKYSEKNSRSAWKKNKRTIRIYPHDLKKIIEPFLNYSAKENWTIWGINLSRKGINLRHRASSKKTWAVWKVFGYSRGWNWVGNLAMWSWQFGNVELPIWRCDLAMRWHGCGQVFFF